MGAAMGAPDLTRPDWQQSVTDEQLTVTIRRGRGKMPPFDLPPQVIQALIRWIRLAQQPAAAAPSATVAPKSSGVGAPDREPGAGQ
jgi:hypothetical protein